MPSPPPRPRVRSARPRCPGASGWKPPDTPRRFLRPRRSRGSTLRCPGQPTGHPHDSNRSCFAVRSSHVSANPHPATARTSTRHPRIGRSEPDVPGTPETPAAALPDRSATLRPRGPPWRVMLDRDRPYPKRQGPDWLDVRASTSSPNSPSDRESSCGRWSSIKSPANGEGAASFLAVGGQRSDSKSTHLPHITQASGRGRCY